MAFTPFVETDLPSMANFNAKFEEAIEAAKDGALADGVKIATGSYVGTGTYGASNPCSLTFDFIPKIVVISHSSNMSIFNVWYYNTSSGIYPYNTAYKNKFTLNGNTLSWYNAGTDQYVEQYQIQLNESGKTYAWFAAG